MNYKMKDMNCLKKKQTKPKWFEGVWYETGQSAKGLKTRDNKRTDKFIVRRRNKRKDTK